MNHSNSGFSNVRPHHSRANPHPHLQSIPVKVIYTLSEKRDIKYSRADVVGVVAKICNDRGWGMPKSVAQYGTDQRLIFTTVQLNDEVAALMG